MIIVLKHKQHFHFILLFFLIASFSSLFKTTHARISATPAFSPHASNQDTNSTKLPMLIVVFVFAFFIIGSCSFYIYYCSDIVEPNDTVLKSKGIDPEILATCPIVVYSAVKTGCCHVALQCAICLGEFYDLDKLRLLPKCSHVFHMGCIDTWLASHVTCPICRGGIGGENGGSKVFGESFVRIVGGENGNGGCGNVDGGVGKSNGSSNSKVCAFGVLVRSHSTGHSLVEPPPGTKSLESVTVEEKSGDFLVMKRSASYDVVWPSYVATCKREGFVKSCELLI